MTSQDMNTGNISWFGRHPFTLPALAEDILRVRGCHLDIRNYGMGASGSPTQLLRLQQLKNVGEMFDKIMASVFPGTGILNNSKALATRIYNPYQFYPYADFKEGHLVHDGLVRPKVSRIAKAIRNYSHLASAFLNLKFLCRRPNR